MLARAEERGGTIPPSVEMLLLLVQTLLVGVREGQCLFMQQNGVERYPLRWQCGVGQGTMLFRAAERGATTPPLVVMLLLLVWCRRCRCGTTGDHACLRCRAECNDTRSVAMFLLLVQKLLVQDREGECVFVLQNGVAVPPSVVMLLLLQVREAQ